MKLHILILLVLVFSFSASSQTKRKPRNTKPKPAPQKTQNLADIYADGWIAYSSTEQTIFYINPSKGNKKGSVVQAWTKSEDKTDKAELTKILYEVNCASQKYRTLTGVEYYSFDYFEGGRREKSKRGEPFRWDTPESLFKVAVPETVAESLISAACKL